MVCTVRAPHYLGELDQLRELYKRLYAAVPTVFPFCSKFSKCLDHNPGQAKDNSRRTSGQHNAEANPWHTPAKTKKLTEHRSNHERPESHDTSTNISDLHEVRKEQLGVTTRDTEQPGEKNVSPEPRPPQTSTRLRAHKQNHPGPQTRHKVWELHLPVPPRMAPRNELLKQQSVPT
ncbi:hypothetical protein Taro_013688 [Colocasia esculenta]|uniref:Uncharacterized protein n=1 Tax=Colocasia esculenta TaxID=4460 RepID=A0A843UGR1_COLES|nr:hypothetical protein [Colocasia esculenta]